MLVSELRLAYEAQFLPEFVPIHALVGDHLAHTSHSNDAHHWQVSLAATNEEMKSFSDRTACKKSQLLNKSEELPGPTLLIVRLSAPLPHCSNFAHMH